MDILHRKISRVDEEVFFVRSSVENPYVYIRFKGIVREVSTSDDKVLYKVEVTDVLESQAMLRTYLNRVRFRVMTSDRKIIDKYFYCYDIPEQYFKPMLAERLSKYLFDLHSLLVFPSETEMNEALHKMNSFISKSLIDVVKFLRKREL